MVRQDPPQVPRPKKPYASPVVHVYGALHTLTKSMGPKGNKDNGAGNTSRSL